MAVSANRSPSPITTRPNPNSRTPDTNSIARRSFSGNPFARPSPLTNPRSFTPVTPANSPAPADFVRRHSVGKEEKENERDQNLKRSSKVGSPAVTKGTKNFMTPTISAASKINASPRKKVLTERNEAVRTSFSLSNGNWSPCSSVNLSDFGEDIEPISEMGLNHRNVEDANHSAIANSDREEAIFTELGFNQNKLMDSRNSAIANSDQKEAVDDSSLSSQVPLNSRSLPEMRPLETDGASDGTLIKNKPLGSTVSPVIAPLDADPSLRPYDPKTNYLSPRPQFLHYKPNPRIEVYLQKENGEGKSLEESFLSESLSSDTEITEETDSENSQRESEDVTFIGTVDEEVEEAHVADPKPIFVGAMDEEVEAHVDDPKPISTPISKEIVEEKVVVKSRFFTRSKSNVFLLVLLVACLSVSIVDSPVLDLSVYEDLSFTKVYGSPEIAEFAKASFEGFARNFQQWSAKTVCYLSKLFGIADEVELGPIKFANLSSLLEDPFVDGYLEVGHREKTTEEIHEEGDEVELFEERSEKGDPYVEADDDSEEALGGQATEEAHMTDSELFEPDSSEAVQSEDLPTLTNPQNDVGFEDQSALNSKTPDSETRPQLEVVEVNPEVVENGEIQADNGLISGTKTESTLQEANPGSSSNMDASLGNIQCSEAVDSSVNWSDDKSSSRYMLAILLLALALAGASVFTYMKQLRIPSQSAAVLVEPLFTKTINQDRPTSHTWRTDVDLIGESCPSGISSFQNSSFYSKEGLCATTEAESQERKHRKIPKRESLASSSMGSPSYGSFTTYEKIPYKHKSRDEEIVTPVRRSSRINKNQVTSP